MTITRIDDLGYAWRRKDGTPQMRVTEKLTLDYTGDYTDPKKLAKKLKEFAAQHDEAAVEIDHDYSSHPDYSCETALELTGWRTVTEDDVKRERDSRKARARTEHLARERQLEAELARLRGGAI